MRIPHALIGLSALLATLGSASASQACEAHPPAQEARISFEQARRIALDAAPGATITEQELEHEHGGSGLRYSFDLKTPHGEREIGIDAMTGRILELTQERPDDDDRD